MPDLYDFARVHVAGGANGAAGIVACTRIERELDAGDFERGNLLGDEAEAISGGFCAGGNVLYRDRSDPRDDQVPSGDERVVLGAKKTV